MSFRSQILSSMAAVALAGALMAQPPGTPPSNPASSNPASSNPTSASPGARPEMGIPPAESQQPLDRTAADKAFVKDAAEGGMTEVELGKLAQEKGFSDAVKEFGKRMVEDHQKAEGELKAAAGQAGIPIPAEPPKKVKKTEDKLAKLSGPDFDRAYAKMMLSDHKNDVKEFQREAQNGQVPQVKAFAAKTLPTLQEHLKQAESLEASVGTGTAASTKK